MYLQEDILSFLRQNMVQKLLMEAHKRGILPFHLEIIKIIVAHFNLGPSPHHGFKAMVKELAENLQVSVRGSPVLVRVAPQVTTPALT